MTIALALEYIPRRMQELGYACNYHLRFRHLRLSPGQSRQMTGYNQLVILVEPAYDVTVESDTGFFNMANDRTEELQYEHRGNINITNNSALSSHVRMIQVIPKYQKNAH